MKIKCRKTELTIWRGLNKELGNHWYDLGFISVDFHKNSKLLCDIYFFWWNVEFWKQ